VGPQQADADDNELPSANSGGNAGRDLSDQLTGATLFGYPVVFDGPVPDVGTGNLKIIIGDFGYLARVRVNR